MLGDLTTKAAASNSASRESVYPDSDPLYTGFVAEDASHTPGIPALQVCSLPIIDSGKSVMGHPETQRMLEGGFSSLNRLVRHKERCQRLCLGWWTGVYGLEVVESREFHRRAILRWHNVLC